MVEASETQSARFAPVRLEDWRAGVERGLKGKSIEERLVAHTAEGLAIQPLYGDSETPAEALPGRRLGSWERREALDARELDSATQRMQRAAAFGIDSFRVDGCSAENEAEVIAMANKLGLALHFPAAANASQAIERLRLGFSGGQHLEPTELTADLLRAWKSNAQGTLLHCASSSIEQGKGAGEQLQIALCLWRAVRWLRAATGAGLALDEAATAFEFEVSLGTDVFLEVAKLRALKLAWLKLLTACGGAGSAPAAIHANTSLRSWTVRDPWVNGLRGTTIAFAAATGGADSILVAPFDALLGRSEADALRLASNTHAILADESHLAHVQDPAAGSGYVEDLTEALAAGAWQLFQKLEQQDDAQAKDWIAQELQRAADAEARSIARRKRGIIGVSEFPNLDETLPEREPGIGHAEHISLAEPFEALRAASDAQRAQTGSRPRAFLANMGTQAEFRARSDFARNLLAAGGIEVLDNEGFASPAAALAAHKESGARVVVIASTDALYTELVPEIAEGLRERGVTVVVAGRAGEHEASWRAAGVAHFIHLGCDAVQVLRALHVEFGGQA